MTARPRLCISALAAVLSLAGLGCTGSTVPWTFEAEPVCADFKVGASSDVSRGGLKKPIRATFKSGNDVVARVVIYGLRARNDAATPLLLPDSNAEYDVEWAECENERAPVVVSKNKPFDTKYECGEAKVYSTVKVQTKSGEPNRKLAVTMPPAAPCWEAATATAPAPSASVAPPPPVEPAPSATAEPAPSGSASAVPTASVAPAASATPAPPSRP